MAIPSATEKPSLADRAIHLIDEALPALRLAREVVPGTHAAGLESICGIVLRLAEMASTMQSNKESLLEAKKTLTELIAIDPSNTEGDLRDRLGKLNLNLQMFYTDCDSLGKKRRFKWFYNSEQYKVKIEGIKAAITSCINEFMLYGNISIEKMLLDIIARARIDRIRKEVKSAPARFNA
ncbi:hypothetical protein C8J57DRAFT_1470329, partial [Mycena rebaudengoi]